MTAPDPNSSWPNMIPGSAVEICARFTLSAPARERLRAGQTPAQYLAILEQGHFAMDVVHLLAWGLKPGDSVNWACRCARTVLPKLNRMDIAALTAAEAWVSHPSAATADRAGQAALEASSRGPGCWAAQAAAAAGGDAFPKFVSGSVLLAAGAGEQPKMLELPQCNLPALKQPPLTWNRPDVALQGVSGSDQDAMARLLLAFPRLLEELSPALRMAFVGALAGIQTPSLELQAALSKVGAPALGGWTGRGIPWLEALLSKASPGLPKLPSPSALVLNAPDLKLPSMPSVNGPGVPALSWNAPELEEVYNSLKLRLPEASLPAVKDSLASIRLPPVDRPRLSARLQPFLDLGKEVAAGKRTAGVAS